MSAVDELAAIVAEYGWTVAVAESLTCGLLASAVGAGAGASTWFRGGLVAYVDDVKFEVLGVTPGPVISESCAREMAHGIRSLVNADLSMSVTGVGGPGSTEGKPAGAVFVACALLDHVAVREHHFDGDPQSVMRQAVDAAVALALEVARA